MANEKRLIYEHSFRNLLSLVVYDVFTAHEKDGKLTGTASVGYYTETIDEVLKQIPTVDAVEVVRCKDCLWFETEDALPDVYRKVRHCYCTEANAYVPENHFCSCGERKGDGVD